MSKGFNYSIWFIPTFNKLLSKRFGKLKHYPHVTLNTDILHKNTAMSFLKYYTKYNYCVLYGNLTEFSNKYNMEKLSSHGYKVSMLKDLEDNIIYNHHISIEYFTSWIFWILSNLSLSWKEELRNSS